MPKVIAIIPARYGSTRFPGKPLAPILGHPMVEWVYRGLASSKLIEATVVATDSQRIVDSVTGFGGQCVITSGEHASGTDRVAEVARLYRADVVVNVQGDEPLVTGCVVDALVECLLQDSRAGIATPVAPVDRELVLDPKVVKVVRDAAGFALYFSRAPIPYTPPERHPPSYLRHIGIYAFRSEVLDEFTSLPGSTLQEAESLEQLKAMEAGIRIKTVLVKDNFLSVDYPSDIELVERRLRETGVSEFPMRQANEETCLLENDNQTGRLAALLRRIRLVLVDCDGVLTDGRLLYDETGRELKAFNVRDGVAVKQLQSVGIEVGVLSGRPSGAMAARANELGMRAVSLAQADKLAGFRSIIADLGLAADEVLHVGDDLQDLPVFGMVGVAVAPADAISDVRRAADIVCKVPGGGGVLREVADLIISSKGYPG